MLLLNILYQIFIAPIEMGMQWVLEFSFAKTNSYGLALIILSLVVNIVLLPLYNLAEKWQQEERDKQSRMANKLKEIKAVFKGQERFMMLQTLYRQNNYHPLLAARNSVGFLIQIPFFFAAFHLLSNYAPLNGQSFWLFKDLGAADGLLSLGSWHINLMPFVMTAINLASAYIYTTELAKKDKIQLYAFALFFLVVLYTSPVALVFYWTMNNVFSLGKNWVVKTLKPTDNKTYNTNLISSSKYNLRFLILFALVSLTGLYIQHTIDLKTSINTYTYLAFILLGIAFLVSLLYLTKNYTKINKYLFNTLIIILSLAYFAKLYKIEQRPLQFLHFVNIFIVLGFIVTIKTFNLFNSSFLNFNYKKYNFTIFKIAISIFGLIFLVNPFIFFLDEDDLSINTLELVNLSLNYYILFTLGFLIIYKIAGSAIKKIIASVLIGYTVIYLFLGYVLPISYGDLDNFKFNDASKLITTSSQDILEAIIYLIVFLFCLLTLNKFIRTYKNIANILLVFFIASFLIYFPTSYFNIDEKQDISANQHLSNSSIDHYEVEKKTTLSFSKEKNILVIVLDGYGAGSFRKIIEENPTIKEELTGFTWYKNTLSTGTSTAASFIALNGGHKYTVESINQRNTSNTIHQEAIEAFNIIPTSFNNQGWNINYSKPQYIGMNHLSKKLFGFIDYDYKAHLLNNHKEYEEVNKNNLEQLAKNEVIKLIMVSSFKGAPYFLRESIYNNGYWHSHNEGAGALKAINYKAFAWGLLTALEEDIGFSSDKPTLKYLWLAIPHRPNAVNDSGLLTGVTDNYTESKQTIIKLIKIFNKLKAEGVYQNTKIIVTSDHGLNSQPINEYSTRFNNIVSAGYESKMSPSIINPLLLVKDFNNYQSKLKTSNLLMSNADVPSLICSEFNGNCGLEDSDPRKNINSSRVLRTSTIIRGDFLSKKLFTITDSYEVKKDIFELNNWLKVNVE